jgi:hypothetical protein
VSYLDYSNLTPGVNLIKLVWFKFTKTFVI